MKNEIKIFSNPEFGQVRTVEVDGEPWFIGKDVAEALGYSNTRDAIAKHVDDDDKITVAIHDGKGNPNQIIINESGVYSLVFGSRLPNAKRFKKWVTSEVLPAIRKHGGYLTPESIEKAILNPDFILKLAGQLRTEQEARKVAEGKVGKLETEVIGLNNTIEGMKPKMDYLDRILKSPSLVAITQIAKDYGMGAPSFNTKLHELKIQHKVRGQWVLSSKYQGRGYVSSETIEIESSSGQLKTVMFTKWTQRGRLFLYEFLKKNGLVPMIERLEEIK